jgi:integrase
MTTAKSKTKLWPPIHALTYTSGAKGWQVACMVKGTRIREAYPTRKEAEARAAQIREMVANEGAAAVSLPADIRAEASSCVEKLREYGEGESLTKAVDHYIATVLRFRDAPPVEVLLEKLLAEKQGLNRRDDTVNELKSRLGRFVRQFKGRQLAGIGIEEVKAYLDDPTQGPRSRCHMRTKIGILYNFAIKHGWCAENPVEKIDRPTVADGEIGIFTVEEAAQLLTHAPDADLLVPVALGLFAGLRPRELKRLDWSKVRLSERAIIIDGSVAKTNARRVITINDALAAWIAPHMKKAGPVVDPRNLRKREDKLKKDAGIKHWPHDGLRHSYASYLYAQCKDAVRVAAECGNTPAIVLKHYRALVLETDAARFWNLRPAGADAEKIVPMKAVANG